tara:strand:- start:1651 stop:2049 length:399 start_codon:yes stop_codon:yes gene_type:complete
MAINLDWLKKTLDYKDSENSPEDLEDKIDLLLNQNKKKGFAAPSSARRRVNLKASPTSKLTQAQQSKALGYDLSAVQKAASRVANSSSPIVQDVLRKAGGRTAQGPRTKLNLAEQSIPMPSVRSRPQPTKKA